jgi:two-component system, OmpR family, response regulator CpxR
MNSRSNTDASAVNGRSILLVDDDPELCSLMTEYFSQNGHRLECAYDGRDGLARALSGAHDLVILDVMLPILDGFEVLRQLRRRSAVPVIMLTARTQQQDRVTGLDAGADDYLPKPFGPDELLARIRAVLRRSGQVELRPLSALTVGKVRVNSQTREVWCGSQPVELTAVEFEILDLLVRSAGRAVSRDAITAMLYQRQATPYERSLDVHMSHLRRKLERGRIMIHTIRGVGYMVTTES